MISPYFDSIWEVNTIPLKTVAAIKQDEEMPSPINALGLEKRDFIRFEIPVYQRGLVWGKEKRKKFLDSIRKGWPTGSIVLTRLEQVEGVAGPLITWHVLDGQQRISTFQHFRENFWKEPWYEFTPEMEKQLESWAHIVSSIEGAPKVTEADLVAGIQLLTHGDENLVFNETYLQESSTFLNRLSAVGRFYVPSENDLSTSLREELESNVRFIRTALLQQKEDLDQVPVSIITVTPKQGTTPSQAKSTSADIFVRLNDGTKLTKYELLNAQWMGTDVDWTGFENEKHQYLKEFMFDQMRERIKGAWDKDDDLDFDPSIEELTESEVTLFDFLYGCSHSTRNKPFKKVKDGIASEERPAFPSGKSEEEIAFDVASLLFIGSSDSNSIAKLPEYFPISEKDARPNINEFAKYYFEAVELINKTLESTRHKTQGKQKAQLGAIQASTYLASYIACVYEVRLGKNKAISIDIRRGESAKTNDGNHTLASNERAKLFQKSLKAWFLHDSLDSVFQGNLANSESKSRVWLDYAQGKAGEQFLQQPSLAVLLGKLRTLFVDEFSVAQAPLRRNYVNSTLALFLTVYQDLGKQLESFTIDHVIPWKKLKDKPFIPLSAAIPLNHPANFMPLEKGINSSRQNSPWADYFEKLAPKDKSNVSEVLFIDPKLCTHGVRDDRNEFALFLMKRWIKFVDKALTNIDHETYLNFSEVEKKKLISDHLSDIASGLELLGVEVDMEMIRAYVSDDKLKLA